MFVAFAFYLAISHIFGTIRNIVEYDSDSDEEK